MLLDEPTSLHLALEQGDSAVISLHGAQVLSWQTPGPKSGKRQEHLYLSPQAVFDGQSAIRGGIPICFPQFNQRVIAQRPLSKHGFARNVTWQVGATGKGCATLLLNESMLPAAHKEAWPFRFAAQLEVSLKPGQLSVQFKVTNTDQQAWLFALALHTYLRCEDIHRLKLSGLEKSPFWDAVAHLDKPGKLSAPSNAALEFDGETDRVYEQVPSILTLLSTPGNSGAPESLQVSQSDSFTETVVWTPGQALCKQLADMPDGDYLNMLCIEAAKINQPVTLSPGQSWQGEQTLTRVLYNPA